MKQPTIKDLRTTLNVLSTLNADVPPELLRELSRILRERESQRLKRRVNRMTEEQLISFESRRRTTLRVNMDDGRLIQLKNNELTFLEALKEVGRDRLRSYEIHVRRHPLFIIDEQQSRKRIPNYVLLCPGLFVYKKTTAAEKKHILEELDNSFRLNWDIEIM